MLKLQYESSENQVAILEQAIGRGEYDPQTTRVKDV